MPCTEAPPSVSATAWFRKLLAKTLHLAASVTDLDENLEPRGHRLLSKLPRLSEPLVDRIVVQFATLQRVLRATAEELESVEGLGAARAKAVKESLGRLAENSILDRYQ